MRHGTINQQYSLGALLNDKNEVYFLHTHIILTHLILHTPVIDSLSHM